MSSEFGEALDLVTDNFENIILFFFKIIKYKNIKIIIIYIILIYLINLWYGFVEALNNYTNFGHDNFYKIKQEKFVENKLLYKLYLSIQKQSYINYKLIMPKFNKQRAYNILYYLKTFGPGNYNILGFFIIYYYRNNAKVPFTTIR